MILIQYCESNIPNMNCLECWFFEYFLILMSVVFVLEVHVVLWNVAGLDIYDSVVCIIPYS